MEPAAAAVEERGNKLLCVADDYGFVQVGHLLVE